MSPPTAEEQLRFLTNLQRLLAEGQFVATYKYALLLALADIAVESGDYSGDSLKIHTGRWRRSSSSIIGVSVCLTFHAWTRHLAKSSDRTLVSKPLSLAL